MRRIPIGASVLVVITIVWLALSPALLLELVTTMERGRAGLTEHRITVEGLEIVYTDGGQGGVIVMVHGFNADKDNWTRIAASLTGNYRVIALDLPGFGQSDRLEERRHDTVSQSEALKAFNDALGLSTVHLVGNSMEISL